MGQKHPISVPQCHERTKAPVISTHLSDKQWWKTHVMHCMELICAGLKCVRATVTEGMQLPPPFGPIMSSEQNAGLQIETCHAIQ